MQSLRFLEHFPPFLCSEIISLMFYSTDDVILCVYAIINLSRFLLLLLLAIEACLIVCLSITHW